MPSAPTGKGEGGRVAVGAALLLVAGAAAAVGCGSDPPALTLEFEGVPPGTQLIAVALQATDVRFEGPDAGDGDVTVSYVDGQIDIDIGGDFAARHGNRIRLPLTAGADIGELDGTARATGGVEERTAHTMTPIMARQGATLRFDFGSAQDGGGTAGAGGAGGAGGGTGGAGGGTGGAGGIAGGGVAGAGGSGGVAGAGGAGGAAGIGGAGGSGGRGGSGTGGGGRGGVGGSAGGGGAATGGTGAVGGSGGVAGSAGGAGGRGGAGNVAGGGAGGSAGAGGSGGSGGTGGSIAKNCSVAGQYTASVAGGGSGPTVAFSTAAGVFGVAWKGQGGDLLYNAVTPAGILRLGTDKTVVSMSGQSLSAPRLARAGGDLIVAYGRRDATGVQPVAQAAVVRIAPATGAPVGTPATGMNAADTSAAPQIGDVAVSDDGAKIGVISRPDSLNQLPAIVDAFSATPAFTIARAPVQLGTSRTCGIGWASDRFIAGAVIDATSGGGTLLELSDTNLTVGQGYPFTGAGDLPTIGTPSATISIAGAGDRVAVAWIDSHTGSREIRIALLSLTGRIVQAAVQASIESPVLKSYPHLIFDGAAFALAWAEGSSGPDSQIKLARFDADLTPLAAAPMTVGNMGAASLGGLDIAAADRSIYGIAAQSASGQQQQQLFYVTCN